MTSSRDVILANGYRTPRLLMPQWFPLKRFPHVIFLHQFPTVRRGLCGNTLTYMNILSVVFGNKPLIYLSIYQLSLLAGPSPRGAWPQEATGGGSTEEADAQDLGIILRHVRGTDGLR